MTGSDDEFEDFLKRRKPMFRSPDDMFEPPAELDRVVLRQAREAIESERPLRVFRGLRWATPVALAVTLVLAFTVMLQTSTPPKRTPVPEVTVQNIAERVEISEADAPVASAPGVAANNQAREEAAASDTASDTVMVDLTSPMTAKRGAAAPANTADRYAAPPPPAAPMAASRASESVAMDAPSAVVTTPSATSTEVPTWRRDAKTWLAEIERLRKAGDAARADAEYAEFKRQQRAYAVGPDR